ncbi:beta strand repeat-containing protein, partial [Candidatus Thiosymbion oneisti]
ADRIDVTTGTGGIYLAETNEVTLGNTQEVTAAGPIQVTAGNTLTVGQAVTTTGTGGAVSLTAGTADTGDLVITNQRIKASGDVTLTAGNNVELGRIVAGTETDWKDITVTAGGTVTDNNSKVEDGNEEENLVGDNIKLTAGSGIGTSESETTDIDTAADRIDAKITGASGGIFIAETDAVTLGNTEAVTAAGPIQVTAGNTLTVGQAVTTTGTEGAVTLTADAGDLVIDDQTITATGAVELTAANNVALGRVVADSNTISVTATSGVISDAWSGEDAGNENLVGGDISLTAGSGIGAKENDPSVDTGDIDTEAVSLDAKITGATGGIFITETGDVTLGSSNTKSGTTESMTTGGGAIEVTSGGNMTVAQAVTTAGNGKIDLTTTAGNLQVDAEVRAGGDLVLDAAGLLETADGPALSVNDGGLLSAGGAVSLAARGGNIALGRVVAGTDADRKNITVTAGGAISDHDTAAEGPGNENLVGGAISLTAGTGIGGATVGDDIDTAATSISADTADGGIDIANTLGSQVTVSSLTSSGTGDIRFDQSGGGAVDFATVTTNDGAITLTNTGAGLSVTGSVEAGGAGKNLTLTTTGSGDITLSGTTTAADDGTPSDTDDKVHITSAGAIDGAGLVTAAIAELDAATGIGGATPLALAAARISADTTDGSVDVDNTLDSQVTVSSLTSGGTGDIQFDQSGGGAVDFATVTTDDGAVTLTNTGAGLKVTGPIKAGGTGKNLTLTTFGSGDITLTGTTTATDDEVHITSAGAIDGAGLVTAAIADLDAATGIGDTTALELATARISADTTDGGIDIDNTSASAVTVTSLTSTNSAGNASGDIRFDQSGGGAVTFSTVTTNDGAITLTNTNAGLSVSGPITAGGAGNAVNLDAAGLLHIAAAVSGSNVELTGGTGITHTAAGDVTSGGTITATAEANDISMADGTRYSAGGAVSLTAQNNIALGRVEAGAAISVTATTGAISDNTAAEGAGNENLVGGSLTLRAATGIGASGGAADIDTAAGSIDAQTTTGGIFIDETDAVTLGPVTTGSGGGPIEVTAGAMTVAQAVTTAGGGAISLTTTAGDLQVGQAVTAGGALSLDAAGQLIVAAAVSGSGVELSGGAGVAHTAAGDVTSSGGITATAAANDISMADGTRYSAGGAASLTAQGSVALGRVEAGTSITVTAATGAISDNTAAEGAGNENLVGRDVSLTAATGVGASGAAADIDTAADTIDAGTQSGGIYLAETDAVQLGNQASVTTGDGGGAVEVTAGGALTVARAVTTAGGGAIRLTTRADDLQVEDQVTAGGASSLGAAARLILAAAVSGSEVELSGGTGIAHTAAGDVTATSGAITAVAAAGDIDMADGTLYQAAGNAELRAQGSVALGRIDAGADAIAVTATAGAISDNTAAEGAGNENLVAGDLSLTAATGIGAPGAAADIDTAVDTINAQTTRSGGIYLAETDAVTLASTTGISAAAGADIDIRSGGEMVVEAGDVQAFASGDIRLTATAGDLVIGGEVATDSGDLELTADGSIRQAEGRRLRTRSDNQGTLGRGLLRTRSDNQGTLALRSGQAIGTADAPILTDVAILAAEAAGGGVFATQVDGTQGNLVIGTTTGANPLTGITAHNGDIEVTTQGFGSPPDYGRLDILGRVRVVGSGDIRLCAEAAQSDLVIRNIVSTDKGIVELEAGRRIISDFDLSGFLIRHDTVVDSSLQLTRSLFENLAEAYAVPDYSVNDELDLMYLSSPNEAIWGENRRRDEDEAAAGSEAE